ncbi:MAG: DUF2231 domain-containing protein [Actinomycetota bacterium]|nr:DUF2231 domain-containing protein [Actinomycetota bacterium]
MRLSYLWRGLPGHPIHPPLTDATIGIYTFATIAALLDVLAISDDAAAHAWWLGLLVGLIVTVPTAGSGLLDWLTITWGTPLWRTATTHLIAMVSATLFFLLAAILGKDSFDAGDLAAGDVVLTLIGFGLLTVGGWLGGTIVYVHGMRVLNLVEEPALKAAAPVATPEKRAAAGEGPELPEEPDLR